LPFSIAIRSLQREAIRLDPKWNHGRLRRRHYPEAGMRMARKLGVITYRSRWNGTGASAACAWIRDRATTRSFGLEFEVESYSKATRAGSCAASTPTATSTSAVRWTGSTSPNTADGDVDAGWAGSVSNGALAIGWHRHPVPAAAAATGAEGLRAAGATAEFLPLPRRRALTRSWWTSPVSGPRFGDFLRGSVQCRREPPRHPDQAMNASPRHDTPLPDVDFPAATSWSPRSTTR
jgi:homoserine O-acetyltransferase